MENMHTDVRLQWDKGLKVFLKLFYLLASFSGDISDVFVTGSEDTNIQLMICIQFFNS